MTVRAQDFTMFEEETRTLDVSAYDEDDALIDFSGATITWRVKDGNTTILTKTVGSGITVTGTGTFSIALDSADTLGLSGDYQHECVAVLADTTRDTLFTGTLTVEPTLVP